jgi:hypothetical protein
MTEVCVAEAILVAAFGRRASSTRRGKSAAMVGCSKLREAPIRATTAKIWAI